MVTANPDVMVHNVYGSGGGYAVYRSVHDGLGILRVRYYVLDLEFGRPPGRTEYASQRAAHNRATVLATTNRREKKW